MNALADLFMRSCSRFLQVGITIFLQRVQYFYSVLAIGNPRKIADIDW